MLEADHLLEQDVSRAFAEEHFGRAQADEPVDRALRLDTEVMLVDDPVKRVDNMTMAWGLEARVPFLDHEFVELAAACPPALKLAHGGKGVLKEASRRVLPAAVIDRPKGYFPVPQLSSLEGEALELVRDVMASSARAGPRPVPPRVRRHAARGPGRARDDARGLQALAGGAAGAVAAAPRAVVSRRRSPRGARR